MSYAEDEFSKVSKFVLEANKICQEFFGPGGGEPDKEAYEDEVDLYEDIMRLIREKNLEELKNLQADYLAILQADNDEEEHHKLSNKRLVETSGLDMKGVEEGIIEAGKKILSKDSIESKSEYYALYRYFDYLKDNGESFDNVIKVEKLLARFSSQYD